MSLGTSPKKLKCVGLARLAPANEAPARLSRNATERRREAGTLLPLLAKPARCRAFSFQTVSNRVTAARIVRQRRGWSGTDKLGW
jgi:hypothetical protein